MKTRKLLFRSYLLSLLAYFFFLLPLQSIVLKVNSIASEPFKSAPCKLECTTEAQLNAKGHATRRTIYTSIPNQSKSNFDFPLAYLYGKKYTSNQIQNPTFNK